MFMYINKFQNLEAILFFHTNWPGRVHFSGRHGAVLVSLSHCFLDVVQITDHDLLQIGDRHLVPGRPQFQRLSVRRQQVLYGLIVNLYQWHLGGKLT